MISKINRLPSGSFLLVCHLHSVVLVVFEKMACGCLVLSGSSDHKGEENGDDHEGKEEQDRAVERVRDVIEPARDNCRKGCKQCVGGYYRKVDGIPCPAVKV